MKRNYNTEFEELSALGYIFEIYACTYKGRRFVSEISAFKKSKTGMSGHSYGCDQFRQAQLQQMEKVIRKNKSIKSKVIRP